MPYDRYAKVLKWMCAALFAYVATVFVVHVPWGRALRATVLPSFSWKTDFITSIVAVLGTTISPYLFFWQAEQEVEIEHANPHGPAAQGATRRRPRRSCTASAWTPTRAWPSPTSSPSSSS